jgi:hypothetical protein
MTIRSIAEVTDAYDSGRYWTGYTRKVHSIGITQTTDMSYLAGIPVANYYASTPLAAAVLGYNDGIYAGPPVASAGHKKYLHRITYLPPTISIGQATFWAHDIVMYYPFVDGDGGNQTLINSITIPRYGGEKCRIMLVSQGVGTANSFYVYITYTNTSGVQKISRFLLNSTNAAGNCLVASDGYGSTPASAFQVLAVSPYLALAQGDTGVKSIDAIDIQEAVGGIFAAVIVKPLGLVSMQERSTAPIEIDYARDRFSLPEIEDGANIYMMGRATTFGSNAVSVAEFSFIWG